MKEGNIDNELAIARSPDPDNKIKTHAERRVKLNDTIIKKLKVGYKDGKKIVSSVGDSEVMGILLPLR